MYIFTSESVSAGHPDKVADQISDAIVDACLNADPKSRVACECLVKDNTVVLAGEITTNAVIDYEAIARKVIIDIGYTKDLNLGFDGETCEIIQRIGLQSRDIAAGVNEDEGSFVGQGAGDQGLMFGYAVNETPELMPVPIVMAHELLRVLNSYRKDGDILGYLRPDAKSQVSIKYSDAGVPISVHNIVISTQHSADVTQEQLRKDLIELVITPVVNRYFVGPAGMPSLLSAPENILINPTGIFIIGGPVGDCGLTGRKIIVDTYGGMGRHGGGAFSSKDPSKVDRSAAYMARYVAKSIVAAGYAHGCEVQIAYAIGYPKPVSTMVRAWGRDGKVFDPGYLGALAKLVDDNFDLSPAGIEKELNLRFDRKFSYQDTASYGHFGRSKFPWEQVKNLSRLLSVNNGHQEQQ